MSHNVMSCNI